MDEATQTALSTYERSFILSAFELILHSAVELNACNGHNTLMIFLYLLSKRQALVVISVLSGVFWFSHADMVEFATQSDVALWSFRAKAAQRKFYAQRFSFVVVCRTLFFLFSEHNKKKQTQRVKEPHEKKRIDKTPGKRYHNFDAIKNNDDALWKKRAGEQRHQNKNKK